MENLLLFFGIIALFSSPAIIKYLLTHNKVNMQKFTHKIEEANQLRIRYNMTEQLLDDISYEALDRANIKVKSITITWSDNITSQEKQLQFFITGADDESEQLAELARAIRLSTCQRLQDASTAISRYRWKKQVKPTYVTSDSKRRKSRSPLKRLMPTLPQTHESGSIKIRDHIHGEISGE